MIREVRTINDMKVGDRLCFGRYGVNNGNPEPIIWLKATSNNDFISERALDYLMFDGGEGGNPAGNFRFGGNPIFRQSNLCCFLNSDRDDWYEPMHEFDQPPSSVGYTGRRFRNHFGFLYHFYDYEDAALCSVTYQTIELDNAVSTATSKIRLPSVDDMRGANCFQLFRKKGVRPKATDGLVALGCGFDEGSFVPFWTRDTSDMLVRIFGRDGYIRNCRPTDTNGIRPVCTIKGDILISTDEYDNYTVIPYKVNSVEVFTDDDILKLFGVIE